MDFSCETSTRQPYRQKGQLHASRFLIFYTYSDRFGSSIGGSLVIANMAWPNEWAILIGSFLATTGAGLQSLISGPRLLYAISKDNLVPILSPFSVLSKGGEPTRALFFSLGKLYY